VTTQRAAYPDERLHSGVPKKEFGRMIFKKQSSMGDRTKVQSTPSAAARGGKAWRRNVRRLVYIRESFGQCHYVG